MTTKTLAQQQEQLKRMESISALQETNRMLKMDRDKLEQELQQAQAKVGSGPLLVTAVVFSTASKLDQAVPCQKQVKKGLYNMILTAHQSWTRFHNCLYIF